MNKICNWGIIGPGKIAQKFGAALKLVPGANLHAVASRDADKAARFAATHGAAVSYGNYESMAEDPAIDAVYIATPHTYHHAHVLLCLKHKKAVLCEKPMSVSFASTAEMVLTARENKVFLMEAMWSRFLPVVQRTIELVESGEIGDLRYLDADFGFAAPPDPHSRLYDVSLGGGSLLDVGIYPLFFALQLFGKPDQIKAFAKLAPGGADETTNALFYYRDGRMANILSSITTSTPITAAVTGSKGTIFFERPWYKGNTLRIRKNDVFSEPVVLPYGDNGFEFQIQEVQRCLQEGLTESSVMPLSLSLLMSDVLDDICRLVGLRYQIQP